MKLSLKAPAAVATVVSWMAEMSSLYVTQVSFSFKLSSKNSEEISAYNLLFCKINQPVRYNERNEGCFAARVRKASKIDDCGHKICQWESNQASTEAFRVIHRNTKSKPIVIIQVPVAKQGAYHFGEGGSRRRRKKRNFTIAPSHPRSFIRA